MRALLLAILALLAACVVRDPLIDQLRATLEPPRPAPKPYGLERREITRFDRDFDRVADLFASRVDVYAHRAPVTVWTLGDALVAAQVGSLIALPAFTNGTIRFFDESGGSLDGKFVARPCAYDSVSSPYGMRTHPITRRDHMHTGIDLSAPLGTPVVSVGDGVVERTGENASAGRFVVVRHARGLRTKYFHLDSIAVSAHAHVAAGEPLGVVGTTGMSTGPHLHFEVQQAGKCVDPAQVEWPPQTTLPAAALPALRDLAARLRTMAPGEILTSWDTGAENATS